MHLPSAPRRVKKPGTSQDANSPHTVSVAAMPRATSPTKQELELCWPIEMAQGDARLRLGLRDYPSSYSECPVLDRYLNRCTLRASM